MGYLKQHSFQFNLSTYHVEYPVYIIHNMSSYKMQATIKVVITDALISPWILVESKTTGLLE